MFNKLIIILNLVIFCTSSCNNDKSFSLKKIPVQKVSSVVSQVSLPGLSVSSIINKFHNMASQLIFQGENSGNALITSLGNEMDVAVQNANIMMSDQQNTLYEHLGTLQQSFFTQLNSIVNEAKNSTDKAISILQVSNLNLMQLTNLLPLTTKNYHFINNIQGLCQIYQSGDYKLKITGLGFGQDLDNVKYFPSISIGGSAIPFNNLNRMGSGSGAFDMIVNIPDEFLSPHFKSDKMQTIAVSIKMPAVVTSRCGLFFKCKDTINAEWNVKMILMPINAGTITGEEIISGQVLDGVTQTTADVVTSGDGVAPWSRTITVGKNQRILNVRYVCSSGMCGWSYSSRKPGYGADYDILNNGTTAIVYRTTQGPATITHYVDYQTLKETSNKRPITPIKFQFGKVIQLPLSADNTSCSYRLYGKLVTGQEFFLDNNMSESPNKLINRVSVGAGPSGVACQPSFIVSPPY